MENKLVRETSFGKATARITVKKELRDVNLDGMKIGEEMVAYSKVEIVAPNGQIVTDGMEATYIGSRTIVGDAETQGNEVAKEINATIEEMKQEILGQDEEAEESNDIEIAEKIIAEAGDKKLMTKAEIREWKKGYNDLANEGGEGYVPTPISKEEYDWAVELLSASKIKNNIKELLNSNITNYRIYKDTGIAQSTLSDIKAGKSEIGNIKLDAALALNQYFLKNFSKTT